ncbi:MAG: hypothetical protein WBP93_01920 [Pyrinomonadaceae bacterium]
MKAKLALVFLLLLSFENIAAQERPAVSEVDRVRLAEAFRIGDALGNRVWKEWDKAPFAVLLVTPDVEFLIRHPKPSADFALVGYDSLLKSNVYSRKRIYQPTLLATFPAIKGSNVSTIVIGQAEHTDKKTSTPWVVTVLHEHFHQLQNSQPTYYTDVNALNLSRGDESGMWMLNFPFPYREPEVKQQFTILSRLLAETLQAKRKSEFSTKIAAYMQARQKFEKMLSPDDYRYFSFQVWQEGIARYTEYRIAELAAKNYQPGKAYRALKDYKPFRNVADEIKSGILKELSTLQLDDYQRVAFYPLGAGEGLLLDRLKPQWQNLYFADKFYVNKYFNAAK